MLVGALAAITAASWPSASAGSRVVGSAVAAWFVVIVIGYAAADLAEVRIEVRDQSLTLSVSTVPLLTGLVVCSPPVLLAARLVATLISMGLIVRQAPSKLLFNLAQHALRITAAVAVYNAVAAGVEPTQIRSWAAALVAATASELVGYMAIALVIWITAGRPTWAMIAELVTFAPVIIVTNTSLGLLTASMLWINPWSAVMLVVLVAVFAFGYRNYHTLRDQHANLRALYDINAALAEAVSHEDVAEQLVERTRNLLRATAAELAVAGARTGEVWRWTAGETTTNSYTSATTMETVLFAASSGVLAGPDRPELLADRPFDDAAGVPIIVDGDTIATLTVTERLGEGQRFGKHDLQLLEGLASGAAMALRNAQLLDQLRAEAVSKHHQARIDPLTGLGNRLRFVEHVDALLASSDRLAVILLDVDDFKEINDTLGHQMGDSVLRELARRLERVTPSDSLVARLGGDEFVVVHHLDHDPNGGQLAARIGLALDEPIRIDELRLNLRASVGIASAPEHGTTATELLQRADVAMYAAKAGRTGAEVYDRGLDRYSRRRLALMTDLTAALASTDEISVVYQPEIDVRTGGVVSAEALVRWHHPVHGPVPPDEFVPIAEHSGLIADLTRLVLGQALGQLARWWDNGHQLTLSVNLSARNLLDVSLEHDLLAALHGHGIPPQALTLELTETAVMTDPDRAMSTLATLDNLGVRLSIDDFGTGYSSLARLSRMPVSEVKIDRSFTAKMLHDASDHAIVQATINLARNLGRTVVAEGVEDEAALIELDRLGCERAQGYWISRPLAADAFVDWLEQRSTLLEAAG